MKKELLSKYKLKKYQERIKLVLECSNIDKHKDWYQHNHSYCCRSCLLCNAQPKVRDIQLKTFIGVVAALSPACSWENNIVQAISLFKSHEPDKLIYTTYGANVRKAIKIKQGMEPLNILGGYKVRAFYKNLLEPEKNNRVCIDTHILNMLHDRILTDKEKKVFFQTSRYQLIEQLLISEAGKYGMKGHELQAVLWITWKGLINSQTSGIIGEPF